MAAATGAAGGSEGWAAAEVAEAAAVVAAGVDWAETRAVPAAMVGWTAGADRCASGPEWRPRSRRRRESR